ncbi:MAG: gliding motility protein GldC [Chitinophagales bacterium]|nr:gliding motility protein GldC [Bacteroidota bacterium]
MRTTEIKFKIQLDEQNLPEQIKWSATDGPQGDGDECKSMMLAMWDGNEKNTLRFDLWTKDMQIDEMHTHFFQVLLSLGDSYYKATGNPYVQEEIKNFCMQLGDKTRAWEESK